MSANETAEIVLSVDNIVTQFNTAEGTVHAVNGVSFDVRAGELLGVVGESGCGKSVTMMSLVKLVPMPPAKIVKGRAMLDNKDLIQMDLDELQRIRGAHIGFIFQDPMTSLNPVLTVGRYPSGRETTQRFSSPILRWHASAGDDCDCIILRPQGVDCR